MPTANLARACAELVGATSRDLAYVLNKKIVDVAYKAAKNTPKKDPGVIEKELIKDKIGLKIATKQLTGRKGKTYTTAKGRKRTIRRVTRRQIATKTKQLISRRKKRRGFMRAGWIAALVVAGFPVRGANDGRISDSKSKLGVGYKASSSKLRTMIGNKVWGRLEGKNKGRARAQMQHALQKAINDVAKDTSDYAKSVLQKSANKHKGRTR